LRRTVSSACPLPEATENYDSATLSSSEIQKALAQAHKMEVMGHMASGLAHDFNNMLHGVVGALDMMQTRIGQGRTDEIADLLRIALASLKRTAALTHSLLAFWRPQSVELKPVCVNAAIASMEDLLRCTLGDEINVEFALAREIPTIVCDPRQLENALLNMVVNARDAMPNGGRLAIRTFCVDRGAELMDPSRRQCVGLCVADTGAGMAPDVVKHAFDPFFSTKQGRGGTGLGLAMVKGFVDQFGGQIRLNSVVGEGTTMTLYLSTR
jgi:signal transduction histidine kinase